MSVEPVVPLAALEHHEYCPRQCALIHVDGVWADNARTVAGSRAHRRVDSGAHRQERGALVLRGIPLWSEEHGLAGRADAVEVRCSNVVPVEYKYGTRHGLTADLQLCAQALCLEEMLGVSVPIGFIWYGGPRRRHRVELDVALRRRTLEAVEQVRELLRKGQLPPAMDDQRCPPCQLISHCLPELCARPDVVSQYLFDEVLSCAT